MSNSPTRWVIDNFLPEDELIQIENVLYSQEFPWFTMNGVVDYGDTDKRMVHMLYADNETDDYFGNFIPVYRELKADYIIKAKINLDLRDKKTYKLHTDHPYDFVESNNPCLFTGIFNFSDCNGGTLFEDGRFIKSKRNSMIIFRSCLVHAGVCPTDEYFRYGLNINWIGKPPRRGEAF